MLRFQKKITPDTIPWAASIRTSLTSIYEILHSLCYAVKMNPMKLITLNMWGKCGPYQKRWDYFLEQLKELSPDILCLQEVGDDELTEILVKTFRLNHFAAAYQAGLLTISRFPISEKQTLRYQSHSPQEPNYERSAVLTKINLGQYNLMVANTHLAWREDDRPTRDRQMEELLYVIKNTKLPSLICGDLNDIPESSPLEKCFEASYENLIQVREPDVITWDNQNPFIQTHCVKFPDRQIDYILVHEAASKILKVKTCRRTFDQPNEELIFPSDHYGLVAEFEVL